MLTIKVSKTKL